MALELTDQDKMDIRRHMGYGALGLSSNRSLMFFRYWAEFQAMEFRMANLLDEEVSYLQDQLLPNLNQLEVDIFGSRDNLDTKQAAVWHWNTEEVGDRIELYNYHRKILCGYFQLPPGPFFVSGAASGFRFVV